MLPIEDPLAPDAFGGEPEELEVAQRYTSALAELRKSRRVPNSEGEEEQPGRDKKSKAEKFKDKKNRAAAAAAQEGVSPT